MYLFLYDVSAQPRSPRSITHNDIPKSVGLLWLSDQLVAETSTSQHTTLTTENSYAPSGFEPTFSAGERPQTHALDRAATGTGDLRCTQFKFVLRSLSPVFDRHFVNRALAICFFVRLLVGRSGVVLPTEQLIFLFSKFPGPAQWPNHEDDRSTPSSSEITNERSST